VRTNTDHITIGRNVTLTLAILHGVAERNARAARRAAIRTRILDALSRFNPLANTNDNTNDNNNNDQHQEPMQPLNFERNTRSLNRRRPSTKFGKYPPGTASAFAAIILWTLALIGGSCFLLVLLAS